IEAKVEDETVGPLVQGLAKSFVRLQQATAHIAQKGMSNPDEAGAAATEYLRLFGLVALAFMWCRSAEIALPKAGTAEDSDGFYKAKVNTAKFYMERILPQSSGLFSAIMAGSKTMMAFEEAAF